MYAAEIWNKFNETVYALITWNILCSYLNFRVGLKRDFCLAHLIPEMKDGQVLFVLGDVAELPLGVDSADHTVNEACILDSGVAYKWVVQKNQQT